MKINVIDCRQLRSGIGKNNKPWTLYELTATNEHGQGFAEQVKSFEPFPPGQHEVEVEQQDYKGERSWLVRKPGGGGGGNRGGGGSGLGASVDALRARVDAIEKWATQHGFNPALFAASDFPQTPVAGTGWQQPPQPPAPPAAPQPAPAPQGPPQGWSGGAAAMPPAAQPASTPQFPPAVPPQQPAPAGAPAGGLGATDDDIPF